jgi:ankyrin repeat protein
VRLVLSRSLLPGLLALALVLMLAPGRGQAQLMTFPDWYTLANAVANNRADEVAFILRRGDNPNFVDGTGRTPLGYAAFNGNAAIVTLLLDGGARADYRDSFGSTALHWAAQTGRIEVVRMLLKANAPVDAANKHGITPLMIAADANRGDIVRALLDAGADPKKQDFTGRDARGWAAGHANSLRALQAPGSG